MTMHRTARGKMIDMGALARQHEQERAVSNVPINAKGDIIDSRGNVKVTREEVKQATYNAQELPTESKVGIKEDERPTPANNVKADKTVDSGPFEIMRNPRTRADGSEYYEVEWSDGSFTEEDM